MKVISFGCNGPTPQPFGLFRPFLFRAIAFVTICVLSIWILTAIVLVSLVWGSCTTIPQIPMTERRDQVCAILGREPGCFFQPVRLVEGELITTETTITVTIQREPIGTFPMPPDSIPTTPEFCTNVPYVDNLLRFHTGSPEIQQAIKAHFPRQVHHNDVVFFDHLLGTPVPASGSCVITADVMVARR